MDSREKIAADIRAWLEWQQYCGTDEWKVENIASWNIEVKTPKQNRGARPQKSTVQTLSTKLPASNPPKPTSPTVEKPTSPTVEKPNQPVPSWWQSIYENRQNRLRLIFLGIPRVEMVYNEHLHFAIKIMTPKCANGV